MRSIYKINEDLSFNPSALTCAEAAAAMDHAKENGLKAIKRGAQALADIYEHNYLKALDCYEAHLEIENLMAWLETLPDAE